MSITLFATPPDIVTQHAQWLDWKDNRRRQFEEHCPRQRTTTYYFSPSGDDTTGDGSIDNPWETRSKAIAIEAAGSGNMRLRFERGGEWDEDDDWVITHDNVTIDAYGEGEMPLFNAFKVKYLDASNVWALAAGNRYTVAETNDIAWIRKVNDRLGDTLGANLIRVGDSTACGSTSNSWFWGSNVLHINLGGTDPNTLDIEAVISNDNNGVELQGDGCRIEGIRADGFGCHRTTTATQAQPFTSRTSGEKYNLFINLEGYYSGSHVMAHNNPGVSATGGHSMWVNCVAGYPKYNSAGDNLFNSYSTDGDCETWFISCWGKYGTLKSSDWDYATEKGRGTGFYSHVATSTHRLMVMYDCRIEASHTPIAGLGSLTTTAVTSTRTSIRNFRVYCKYADQGIGIKQFAVGIFQANCITYGERLYLSPLSNNPGAFDNIEIDNCWYVNSIIEVDGSFTSAQWGFMNRSSGTNSIHIWQSTLRVLGSAQAFGFDYDVQFGATVGAGACADSSLVNSIVAWDTGNTVNAYLALTNQLYNGTRGISNNAYWRVDSATGNERGYEADTAAITLAALPTDPEVTSLKNAGSTNIPTFSHDIIGKKRLSTTPDVGPYDFSSPVALNRMQISTGETGQTVYAIVYNSYGLAWNGRCFSDFTDSRDDFDIPLYEVGTSGLYGPVNVPGCGTGRRWEIFLQSGATPSHTDDIKLAVGDIYGDAEAALTDYGPLKPTVRDRTLDVASGGEAGLDWSNINAPTTTVNLSGTTIKTATDVETDTADIQTRLPAALVSGRMDSSVGAMAANVITAAATATDYLAEINAEADTALSDYGALKPTTAGRTLDVSLTGEAGIDWANIGSPTTTVTLSGTTVKTATDVETDTADIQSRLPAALVSGRIDSSVGAMATNTLTAAALATDAVTEIQTGLATSSALSTVDGNVTTILADTNDIQTRLPAALVSGRMDASVGAMAANVITAAATATDYLAEINAEADTALSDYGALKPTTAGRTLDVSLTGEAGIDWANIGSPTTTVNLSGTTVKTATDVETDTADIQSRLPASLVSGRMDSSVGAMASNTMTAAALATDAVTEIQSGLATSSALSAVDAKIDIIDTNVDALPEAIFKLDLSTLSGEASRSLLNGIRFLRNKWAISGSTLTVYKEDDTTSAWTASVSTAAASPVVGSDPA